MAAYFWEPPPASEFPVVVGTDASLVDHHKSWTDLLESLNMLFAWIFFCEMVMKLLALGSQYFNDGWNKYHTNPHPVCLKIQCTESDFSLVWKV